MDDGWIKLYRKVQESAAWQNGRAAALWVYILLRVSNRGAVLRNGTVLEAGQCLISQSKAAEWLETDRRIVAKILEGFVACGMIKTTKVRKVGTVVSVCKWKTYQGKAAEKCAPNVHQTRTKRAPSALNEYITGTNDVHNVYIDLEGRRKREEGRELAASPQLAPLGGLDEVRAYWTHAGLKGKAGQFYDYNETRGWAGVKNWQAAARVWSSRQKDFDGEAMAGRIDLDLTIPAKTEAAR
jgi:hypothetical protein